MERKRLATIKEIVQKLEDLKEKIHDIPDSSFKAPSKYIKLQRDKLKNRVDNVTRLVGEETPDDWNEAIFILTWRISRLLDKSVRFSWVKDPQPKILALIEEIIVDIESLFVNTAPHAMLLIEGADPGQFYTAPKGLELNFDGEASWDEDGTIVKWLWDFGDGTPIASGVTVKHGFATKGMFRVTLTVKDNGTPAESATDWVDISVQ